MQKWTSNSLFIAAIVVIGILGYQWTHKSVAPAATTQTQHVTTPIVSPEGLFQDLSISLAPLTICEALRQGTIEFKVQPGKLITVNDTQKKFVDTNYTPYIQQKTFEHFTAEELQAYVSQDYQYLNDVLKKNGFSIQVPEFYPPSVGVLAIQNVIVKWKEEGKKTKITSNSNNYDAVNLKEHVHYFAKENDSTVIVELLTKTDDKVYLVTKRDGNLFAAEPDAAAVAAAIAQYQKELHAKSYTATSAYSDIKFPMIMYNTKPDINWILKLTIVDSKGTPYAVATALQEIIFKMNETGAQAKAATVLVFEAMAAPNRTPQETLIIDKPFLIWIERPGVSMPIFADYMTQKYWQNPGELSE